MSFAYREFQSWQQYSSKGKTRDFKNVSMIERFPEWITLNTHPILSLAFLTIFLTRKVKAAVLLVIMLRWTVLCCQYSNHHIINCRLFQFFSYFVILKCNDCNHTIFIKKFVTNYEFLFFDAEI